MKMRISRERLWEMVLKDPDMDVDAGNPSVVLRMEGEPSRGEDPFVDGGEPPRAVLGANKREPAVVNTAACLTRAALDSGGDAGGP